jgi:hypothetical protein
MFTPAEFAPVAVESGAQVRREGFRQEQLAFAKGTKGNGAGGIGAFMEHWLGPVFSSVNFGQRDCNDSARERPKSCRGH